MNSIMNFKTYSNIVIKVRKFKSANHTRYIFKCDYRNVLFLKSGLERSFIKIKKSREQKKKLKKKRAMYENCHNKQKIMNILRSQKKKKHIGEKLNNVENLRIEYPTGSGMRTYWTAIVIQNLVNLDIPTIFFRKWSFSV